MIVTCEECSTSFQLDESRIPASGARVRCSRCKHAFFLPNPATSESDALHSIAEQAAGSDAAAAPSATEDLNESSWDGLGGDNVPSPGAFPDADPSEGPAASPDPEPDLDEEDWQFSEEVRIEGDDSEDDLVAPEDEGFDPGMMPSPA